MGKLKGLLELVLIGILYMIGLIVISTIQLIHWLWSTIKQIINSLSSS